MLDPMQMAATKPHAATNFDTPAEEPTPEPLSADLGPDFEPAYTVEQVVGKRTDGDLVEYELKYRGYPGTFWTPEGRINAEALIDKYECKHPDVAG